MFGEKNKKARSSSAHHSLFSVTRPGL